MKNIRSLSTITTLAAGLLFSPVEAALPPYTDSEKPDLSGPGFNMRKREKLSSAAIEASAGFGTAYRVFYSNVQSARELVDYRIGSREKRFPKESHVERMKGARAELHHSLSKTAQNRQKRLILELQDITKELREIRVLLPNRFDPVELGEEALLKRTQKAVMEARRLFGILPIKEGRYPYLEIQAAFQKWILDSRIYEEEQKALKNEEAR